MAAEARGLLTAMPEPTRLRMSGDDEDDEDHFDEEDDQDDEWNDRAYYGVNHTRPKAAKPFASASAQFKDGEFDYVILDEAQAIKNAATTSSKAARLLCGRHRLALSGTPVENHLGELWTLFDFLNPDLLGAASAFNLSGLGARNPDEET